MANSFGSDEPATNPSAEALLARATALDAAFGAAEVPERLAGIVERVQQDTKQRYLLLRLKEPGAGIALIGSYSTGEGTNASIALYHYGDGAKARVKDSEPKWQEWMATTFN